MSVSIPITLTTITTPWGTSVANDVNGLLARATALEAINAGTRLGTAESEIDALQAATAVIGTQRVKSGTVLIPGDGNAFNVPFATAETSTGVSYDTGVFTVSTAGVYAAKAFVLLDNGQANVTAWLLNWNGEGVPGTTYGGNWFLADNVGYLPASGTVRFQITRANVGTTGQIGSGRLSLWRVSL